jgi:hypothetical protein
MAKSKTAGKTTVHKSEKEIAARREVIETALAMSRRGLSPGGPATCRGAGQAAC